MREYVLYRMGVSGVTLICLLVMPSHQSIGGREGICTISSGREWSLIDMFIGDAVTPVYMSLRLDG